jgi:hypothetical protein
LKEIQLKKLLKNKLKKLLTKRKRFDKIAKSLLKRQSKKMNLDN